MNSTLSVYFDDDYRSAKLGMFYLNYSKQQLSVEDLINEISMETKNE